MKPKYLFVFTFAVLLSYSLSAQSKKEQKQIKKKIEQQLEDFEVFKTSLLEIEAKPYRYCSKDSLDYFLNKLEDSLQNYIFSPKSLYKNYSFIISKIQSGHTVAMPSKKAIGQWVNEYNSLPMDVILFGRKLYVAKDYDMLTEEEMKALSSKEKEQYSIPQYTEIVSIDGRTIKEWVGDFSKYISSDQNGEEFRYYVAKDLFEFYRNLVVTEKMDSINIELIEGRNDTVEKRVALWAPPVKEINERFKVLEDEEKEKEKNYGEFDFYSSKYARFKFVSFYKSRGKKYADFLKESFKEIADKKVDNLIIDLRGNTGGVMQYAFLEYLKPKNKQEYLGQYDVINKDKPTHQKHIEKNKYYRRNQRLKRKIKKTEKKYDRVFSGEITQSQLVIRENTFDGNIIVLTDEATFSAAAVLAADLRNIYGAKIIGTRAGGSFYDGSSGTKTLILPNSKIEIILNPNYFHSSFNHFSDDKKTPDVEFSDEYGDPKKQDSENEKNLKKAIKQLK